MIKAGITGGDSTAAGHLIRILINHPDVELVWVEAPAEEGELLARHHRGLTGETYMSFCRKGNPEEVNVIFLCNSDDGDSERYLRHTPVPDGVKVIDLSPDFRSPEDEDSPWVYAVPLAHLMLLALLPLAKNLLLNAPIHVNMVTPSNPERPGEVSVVLDHEEIGETQRALRVLQSSFGAPILLTGIAGGWSRGLACTIYMDTPISEDELKDMYDEFYEDHGFTFLSESFPDLGEVRGTNKCLLHVQKTGQKVVVSAVLDDSMKGSAAVAVHVMNLLFGLQERVGLTLAATADD